MGESGGDSSRKTPPRASSSSNGGRKKPHLEVDTNMTTPNRANTRTLKPPSPRRSNINSHIEDKIGCCLEEYRCQHNNFTGLLYVGPLGVVFLGRFLLFEWTVVLKWEEVTRVKRKAPNNNGKENSAIRIETSGNGANENGIYDFEGFFDAQKAVDTLHNLHNDSILDTQKYSNRARYTKRGSVVPFRRTNSGPAGRISTLFNFDEIDDNETPLYLEDDENSDKNTLDDLRKISSLEELRNSLTAQNNRSRIDSVDAPGSPPRRGLSRKINASEDTIENGIEEKEMDEPPTEDRLAAEWATVCADVEKYAEVPVRDVELPLEGDDLEAFVEKFVGDDAPFSWSKYMTEVVGDLDVTATKWAAAATVGENGESSGAVKALARTIEYTHPVNAPMAPPTAGARKEQVLKDYGNENGLVIETKTVVSDVPMTDCFYVKDVLQVQRSKTNAEKWVVSIRFEVVFIKSTMFRALINRTTIGEFNTFMSNLAKYISNNCGSGSVVDSPKKLEPLPLSKPAETIPPVSSVFKPSGNSDKFEFGWKIFVAFVFLWMVGAQTFGFHDENQSLRDELRELKSTILDRELQHATQIASLREGLLSEWKSTLGELKTIRAAETQSLQDDLSEWKSLLGGLEKQRKTEAQSLRENLSEWKSALVAEFHSDAPRETSKGASIPRKGVGGPLRMEPMHDKIRGGYRRSGQYPSLEELNDWEKLEECSDCY
jgi:hypothetical protein